MGGFTCELTANHIHNFGTGGWVCFGLQQSQYVPFWCCVAILTLANVLLNSVHEYRSTAMLLVKRQRFQNTAQRIGRLVKMMNCTRRVAVKNGKFHADFVESSESNVTRVATEKMAGVCAERGIDRGLEAACLAVLLGMQRRRNYGTPVVAVLSKGGQPQEVDVQLQLPSMSFAALLLLADKALRALATGLTPGACVEAPELVFTWGLPAEETILHTQWILQPFGPYEVLVCGTSPEEEVSFKALFEACAANPDGDVWQMPMSSACRIEELLSWGKAVKDFAEYRDPSTQRLIPVSRLLSARSARPMADAVVGEGFCLSYEELLRRAGHVQAAVAGKANVNRGNQTAVLYLPRGEAIAPAFLGVLQAGFTVVPIDVHWPGDRVLSVTGDLEAAVALVDTTSAHAWDALGVQLPTILLDEHFFQAEQATLHSHPIGLVDQDDPAIVLFTSGSTGKPKGIVLSHGYLTALSVGVGEWKQMGPTTRTLCYHSPTWMPFIDYLFAPLLQGGCCLYFPDGGSHVVKPTELKDFGVQHGATHAGFVPAILDLLVGEGIPETMANIGIGGAAVPSELCIRVLEAMPANAVLYTGYSGTEQGDVTAVRLRGKEDVQLEATGKGHMSAGRPHSGQSCAILDEAFSPVGPGAIGEVTVAGAGLASGYLNLPKSTADTFLPKLPALGQQRSVRSGDLAVWTESGRLEVVGRRDGMVKVRGARVELGEVEAAVLSHPSVKEAVVTVYEDQLVVYVAPAVPADLREHCKGRLVAYMVPHIFEGLEELPRLPNGKVNKKALAKPRAQAGGAETVMELDSLGQMRKFTRSAASEDRVLDNVRAILIGIVIQSHAIPLLASGPGMLDVEYRSLNASWGPVQLYILQLARSGGWSSLAFLSGFDDTRAEAPYGLTYREPLFLALWLILGFQWSLWYLPAFVLMRAAFCAAHWAGLEKTNLLVSSQVWLLMPAFVDLYVGWRPNSPVVSTECPSQCFCPWQKWPAAQNVAYYTLGWWVDFEDPVGNSFTGHGMIFIPCYWIGFYLGGGAFKVLTKVADETNYIRRISITSAVLAVYCIVNQWGYLFTSLYDDRCSSFWQPGGLLWLQILKNVAYMATNLSMSLLYVLFIAAAVPIHLKYLAKICFPALIASALTPCILDLSPMVLELRKVLPAALSPGLELAWSFTVPFLYELVVGAAFALLLPLIARAAMRAVAMAT